MLLRRSRAASALTKSAVLGSVGRGLAGFGRGLVKSTTKTPGVAGKVGWGAGRTARAAAPVAAGAGLVGFMAMPQFSQAAQKARVGMDPRYLRAQNWGQAPRMR